MFDVGQRVLCIQSGWGEYGMLVARAQCPNVPVRGQRYTIRTVGFDSVSGLDFVRLVEVVNPLVELVVDISPWRKAMSEPTFDARNFVPIEEHKTDISIFTEMLEQEPGLGKVEITQ